MNQSEPKTRRKLNTEQLEVLNMLYRFRFGTNDLFAQHFGKKDRSFVFKRLKILEDQGLIGKRFDSSYRLQGKPAAYYLRPAGARALQQARPSKTIHIKGIYKDATVSEEFVTYCLTIFSTYRQFRNLHGDTLDFFTRTQLANQYRFFEDFVPAVYIRLKDDKTDKGFFLEYLQSSKPFFAVKQRIEEYITYCDSGDWEDGTKRVFPKVLFMCETPALYKRLLKAGERLLEYESEDLQCFAGLKGEDAWINLADPGEALPLGEL
jgi:hypothetical protein